MPAAAADQDAFERDRNRSALARGVPVLLKPRGPGANRAGLPVRAGACDDAPHALSALPGKEHARGFVWGFGVCVERAEGVLGGRAPYMKYGMFGGWSRHASEV